MGKKKKQYIEAVEERTTNKNVWDITKIIYWKNGITFEEFMGVCQRHMHVHICTYICICMYMQKNMSINNVCFLSTFTILEFLN